MAAAAAVHNPDEGITGISLRGDRGAGLNVYIFTSFLRVRRGLLRRKHEAGPDSPEAIEAAEFYAELLQYGFPGPANVGKRADQHAAGQRRHDHRRDRVGGPVEDPGSRLWPVRGLRDGSGGPHARAALSTWACLSPPTRKQGSGWQFVQWATTLTSSSKRAARPAQ